MVCPKLLEVFDVQNPEIKPWLSGITNHSYLYSKSNKVQKCFIKLISWKRNLKEALRVYRVYKAAYMEKHSTASLHGGWGQGTHRMLRKFK